MFGSGEGFRPKNTQGVMANYCAICGNHLDVHGFRWLTGKGSTRTCPPSQTQGGSGSTSSVKQNTSIAVDEGQSNTPSPSKGCAPPLPTPFGTDTSFEFETPRRSKKVVATAPHDSMAGGCNVVRDEPAHIPSPSPLAPRSSLVGSGVQSTYDERQEWVPTKSVKNLESKLEGATLVPARSDSPKKRGPRTVIR